MKVISDEDAPKIVTENAKNAACELEKIYYSHTGRRIFKWHHYLEIYDAHMSPYRDILQHPELNKFEAVAKDGKLRILELGVQNGGSLQMWRKYFGEKAIIFGIDIDARCKQFEENKCEIRIGSQADSEFLNKVISEMGGVDIVLDDGSHIASHQLASFKALFGKVNNGGLYIVEDLHTSYWDDWEGGLRKPGAFLEVVKDVIDHMHEWYVGVDTELNDLKIKILVKGLHIYDSMVVIKKETKTEPYAVHVGVSSFTDEVEANLGAKQTNDASTNKNDINDEVNVVSTKSSEAISFRRYIASHLSSKTKCRVRNVLQLFRKNN